jgi:hypothetical protein
VRVALIGVILLARKIAVMNTFTKATIVTFGMMWSAFALGMPPHRTLAQETISVSFDEKTFIGKPLFTSAHQTVLLARDGRIRRLPGSNSASITKISQNFKSYSHTDLESRLRREFGPRYEISFTRHYVVVHPRCQAEIWAKKFEMLFTSFQHYFESHGVTLQEPEFKLVALVFHSRPEFVAYTQRMKEPVGPRMIGYYSGRTNRIALYDAPQSEQGPAGFSEEDSTVYHEATHQAAFNCGIHQRFTAPPRWASEGLGTLFESPGVWNAASYSQPRDRVNRRMLKAFLKRVKSQPEVFNLEQLISNDELFQNDPVLAYACSWALSFYLSETYPNEYIEILRRTSEKAPFKRIPSAERKADWEAVFKQPLDSLEAQILNYYAQLD